MPEAGLGALPAQQLMSKLRTWAYTGREFDGAGELDRESILSRHVPLLMPLWCQGSECQNKVAAHVQIESVALC